VEYLGWRFNISIEPVNTVEVLIKLIITKLEPDIHKNQEASCHPNSQPNNIYQRKAFMPPKVTEGDFYIVLYHNLVNS
jgi:hypothetical protein